MKRFWDKVNVRGPAECWNWKASCRSDGRYGCIGFKGSVQQAHRVSFELANGREPVGHVLHSCDNGLCVNPAHLSEGTHEENMRQRDERGRHWALTGHEHPRSKMCRGAVQISRHLRALGATEPQIAQWLGVHVSTINRCNRGLTCNY